MRSPNIRSRSPDADAGLRHARVQCPAGLPEHTLLPNTACEARNISLNRPAPDGKAFWSVSPIDLDVLYLRAQWSMTKLAACGRASTCVKQTISQSVVACCHLALPGITNHPQKPLQLQTVHVVF